MTMQPAPFDSFGGKLPFAGSSDTVGAPAQSIAKAPAYTPQPTYKSGTNVGKCYETHPVLSLGGGTFVGGSCSRPMVSDANVYIGFEMGMTVLPYVPGEVPAVYLSHYIPDRGAPKDPDSFASLVKLAAEVLAAGGIVHAGCIGGHGRTGTFLAALVKHITGNEDAIQWVRDNYCKKAVESSVQIEFLSKHWGIIKRDPSDAHYAPAPSSYQYPQKKGKKGWSKDPEDDQYYSGSPSLPGFGSGSRQRTWEPVRSNKDIARSGLI